jgi:hypothetical protein
MKQDEERKKRFAKQWRQRVVNSLPLVKIKAAGDRDARNRRSIRL